MTERTLVGSLIVGGFSGTSVPSSFARALARGERGGAILFKRNVTGDIEQCGALNETLRRAFEPHGVPLIAVDQEGGRVVRLGPPLLALPPMLHLARAADAAFLGQVGELVGRELAALGFTMNMAPVLDVNTNPQNPIIGDRAFGTEPETAATLGVAFGAGLERGGVLACGKHFPGHGDTDRDSHLELPYLNHDRERLDSVELVPFRHAARAGLAALMTAHVVCRALDPERPATLSSAVATDLRQAIGFDGLLVSDDLEMRAIADTVPIDVAAISAVEAGCDIILVCSDESQQDRAFESMVLRAERDLRFRERCREASSRRTRALSKLPRVRPPLSVVGGPESKRIAESIALRLARKP